MLTDIFDFEYIQNKNFLVRLPMELNIPEWQILSTNRPICNEILKIDVAEIYENKNRKPNILKVIDYINLNRKFDSITIDILDNTGIILYSIVYKNITLQFKLKDLTTTKYLDNDYAIINLEIEYDFVNIKY